MPSSTTRAVIGLLCFLGAASVGAACDPTADLEGHGCDGQHYESHECGDGGLQWCYRSGQEHVWGRCVYAPECEPGETEECQLEGGSNNHCTLERGVPTWTINCWTPLVLVFDDAPVELTEASATPFDISGVGACFATDWPTEATPWLARDVDRDGVISGAHELFGSATLLASRRPAPDGFAALAELDVDGDGVITERDPGFAELVLWVDHDGDRRGQLDELTPVTARGVTALELGYTIDRRCDVRGNCEVERSAFSFDRSGRLARGAIVDLHLACQ
ncbi:MAG: calcium-binding protein [Nannocystaceae bacterium]